MPGCPSQMWFHSQGVKDECEAVEEISEVTDIEQKQNQPEELNNNSNDDGNNEGEEEGQDADADADAEAEGEIEEEPNRDLHTVSFKHL